MSKKSVLMATLLAGMGAFTGCEQKNENVSSGQEKSRVQLVSKNAEIQHFKKITESVPVFLDEIPRAMVLPNGKGGYVHILYPATRNGSVSEDKDQYEKRIEWLNKKYPIDIPNGLSLRGCKWMDRSQDPEMPFVSIFDKKEYIYQHIGWMKGFYKPGNKFKVNYALEKDPVVLWWVAQVEFHGLFAPQKGAQKAHITPRQREGRQH